MQGYYKQMIERRKLNSEILIEIGEEKEIIRWS